jgi:23S rRNA pseudouridine1911/1915/1917 synthase
MTPDDEDRASTAMDIEAAAPDAGQRLDRLLALRLPELSRSRLQALIRDGAVRCGGATIRDPGRRVKPGQRIRIAIPAPEPALPEAQHIPLSVVYENERLIVIDKPAGLVVHPAAGQARDTLVNALIAHCGASLSGIGGVRRPGIVHRLDKDTSGLMVVAKTDAAHRGLSAQFAAHGADGRLTRAYLALVWGQPSRARGAIDASLARSDKNRTRIAVTKAGSGRRAVTHYAVLDTYMSASGKPAASLLRLELETGRTHQIRVHLAHIGHPVLGDPVYGASHKASAATLPEAARDALGQLGRQALHAAELGFVDPGTGRKLSFTSELPAGMARLRAALEAARPPGKKREAKS